MLLIGADISILGQVVARFLKYDWFNSQTGRSFPQTLFSNPVKAFYLFPDLFCLILGVLMAGFFLKVWYEAVEEVWGRPKEEVSLARFRLWLYSIIFLLSIAIILAMAYARLIVPVGNFTGATTGQPAGPLAPRVISAVLGLSLPLVGAGFFLRGWSLLAPRANLWRLSLREWQYDRRRNGLSLALSNESSALGTLRAELGTMEEEESKAISAAHQEFSLGYREGIARLFTRLPGQSIQERVRPIAIRTMLIPHGKKR
jgi:hypothetical protein